MYGQLRDSTDVLESALVHDGRMCPDKHEHRIVRVDRDWHGDWEVFLGDGRTCVTCETLDDARRLAYLHAGRMLACEVVIRDAYHRVIDHALIDSTGVPAGPGAAS